MFSGQKFLVCIISLFCLTMHFNLNADSNQYQIRDGDTLSQILESKGYASRYPELLPFINATIAMNPQAFVDKNPNRLILGSILILPNNPNKTDPVIGEIIVSKGTVTIEKNGESIEVKDKATLSAGTVIITENLSRADVNLLDESSFKLGANSQLEIETYRFKPEAQDNTEVSEENSDSLIAKLSKGAVRVISGLIGKLNRDNFQINSALNATIGIRGTDFTLRSCTEKSECGDLYGVSVGVQQGGITLQNKTEAIELDQNQFSRIESSTAKPTKTSIPKGFFNLEQETNKIRVSSSVFQKETRSGNSTN